MPTPPVGPDGHRKQKPSFTPSRKTGGATPSCAAIPAQDSTPARETAAGAPVEAAAAEGSASAATKEPAAERESAEWDALVAAAATTEVRVFVLAHVLPRPIIAFSSRGGKEGEQKATRADEKLQSLRQQKGCQRRHWSERKPLEA